jgi:Ca2+:H+ antiporter
VSGRRLFWLGTALVPADIGAALAGVGDAALFVISAIALVPLAWVIGESTEQVGEHTGPAIAGLLNASFGNAPELMVALFSVHRGLFEVVRGSLIGSVIGNLLLVLGFSLLVAPRGTTTQPLSRRTTLLALGQVALAAVAFLLPAAVHWSGGGDGLLRPYALPPMVVLLGLYLVTTATSVRRETRAHRAGGVVADPHWSLPTALTVLGLATVATVVVTEILTGSIQTFADETGLGDFFVAGVIVAIVGNAAEHGGAVVIASRGNVRLAAEIALSSATQVALFVIPVVVFLSLTIRPLPLAFRPAELAGLGAAVVIPALLLADARAAVWKGAVLCGCYGGIAALFWAVG